jgi:NADH-quinone oxidoreductase subunit D
MIKQCINLIPVGAVKVDDKKLTPPTRYNMKQSMNLVISHFKYYTDGFSINKDNRMH